MPGKPTDSASEWQSLSEMLQQRASAFPHRAAFVYEDETRQSEQWTYGELDVRSRQIAAWLTDHCNVGDRALLVYPPGLEFAAAFFGCIYAGVLPVPATYPKPRRPMPRVDAIANDCQPTVVLTHSSVLSGLCLEEQSPAICAADWQATDEIVDPQLADFCPIARQAEDLAFLQYTSGSTSEPRGVMVSHGNLLHNLAAICEGFAIETQADQVPKGVFWLPAYHDMGLIGGILTPIYVGGTSYLLAPTTFLRTPRRWLELLSETRASISGAPNFGYELAVQKTTPAERSELHLQDWRLAFCGAEPIHPDTLQEFADAFAVAGFRSSAFYPCYGLAEVTLLATGGLGPAEPRIVAVDRQQLSSHQATCIESSDPRAVPLVSCGSARNGNTVAIVNPQSVVECREGQVGEIWVRGGSVAQGYWNQEQLNRELFHSSLNGDRSCEFLRTGDLGFYLGGELFVTGRLKDVIIIRGRNHYPHDLERTAQAAHEAVDLGAAFSVEAEREEQLVVVHQIRREHRKADMDEVLRSIRTSIVDEHELDPQAIVLIRPVSLPITSSGKVQRSRAREQYLANELPVVAQWSRPLENRQAETDQNGQALLAPGFLESSLSADPAQLTAEVEKWLISWLTERADLAQGAMQPETPFAELGIDSLTAVEISQEMDQLLGLQLPPMVIWSYPSAAGLSAYLAEQLQTVAASRAQINGILNAEQSTAIERPAN
ncbi:MAG: AMP-binding protein [Planctomycetales bacterium]|nr:AMP-binding protein [Planctomycetales bacterium]